jgi:hypothetical protein
VTWDGKERRQASNAPIRQLVEQHPRLRELVERGLDQERSPMHRWARRINTKLGLFLLGLFVGVATWMGSQYVAWRDVWNRTPTLQESREFREHAHTDKEWHAAADARAVALETLTHHVINRQDAQDRLNETQARINESTQKSLVGLAHDQDRVLSALKMNADRAALR